jgi:hypothetical protein
MSCFRNKVRGHKTVDTMHKIMTGLTEGVPQQDHDRTTVDTAIMVNAVQAQEIAPQ